MLNRIKTWLIDGEPQAGEDPTDTAHLAAAALLVEAARMDDSVAPAEAARIEALVRRRFGLTEEEAVTLRRAAEKDSAESAQFYGYATQLKDRLSYEQRVEIIEMLWEVAYADGKLHDLESSLLRRIGGLLYVSDRDRGAARLRVLERLGISDPATEV